VDNESHTRSDTESTMTYQQQAYEFAKAQITGLAFKPGQYITDSEIAEALGISRTPVREALRRLEQEGLLTNEARRGWKVYALSLEDIEEIFDLKGLLEGRMAFKAARCVDDGLRTALQEAIEHMKQATTSGDYEPWRQADIALHRTIQAMCQGKRLCDIVQNLNDQWIRLHAGFIALEGRMEQSCREHEVIVESILDGDSDEAQRRMQIHIDSVKQDLLRVMEMVLPFLLGGV
jgi:DNA-binding GntR family transcriptional regulator